MIYLSVVEVIWKMPVRVLDWNLATLQGQKVLPDEVVLVNANPDMDEAAAVNRVCAKYPIVRVVDAPRGGFNLAWMCNVGIQESKGKYLLLTAMDNLFSQDMIAGVYKAVCPGGLIECSRGDLPIGYNLGEPETIHARWPKLLDDLYPGSIQSSPGTIIGLPKEWLEKVHGFDETRNPYTYTDSDLLTRAWVDGLHRVGLGWQQVQVLHLSHPRNDALYYGVGGEYPDNTLPVVRNLGGWGRQ